MKYMLLIYGNEEAFSSVGPETFAEIVRETDTLNQELFESGELVGAYGVADQVNAKVVRVTAGAPVVTDGPYAEAKEYLGSFTIVDCDSLERALEIAARNPAARYWGVEVRPPHARGQRGAVTDWRAVRRLVPEVLSALVRRHGHFDACEDAVQEALRWPPPSGRCRDGRTTRRPGW